MLKRRKQRRKPRDEIIWYAMRVEAWNFDYHFGDVVFRHDPRNYREFSTYHKSAWLRDSPEKKGLFSAVLALSAVREPMLISGRSSAWRRLSSFRHERPNEGRRPAARSG